MSDWPNLRRAPIVEGLLDIKFPALPATRLDDLEALQPMFPSYSAKSRKVAFGAQVRLSPEGSQFAHRSEIEGYVFADHIANRAFQARLDGVTLSFLAPYSSFEDLRAEAQRLWAIVREVIRPGPAIRLALRYINRLQLAVPCDDFRDYIRIAPDVPPSLPQGLSSFFLRVEMADEGGSARAIVTELTEPQIKPHSVPLIFDIDVFREFEHGANDEEMWNALIHLREFKNRIFFDSITERLLEEYR